MKSSYSSWALIPVQNEAKDNKKAYTHKARAQKATSISLIEMALQK